LLEPGDEEETELEEIEYTFREVDYPQTLNNYVVATAAWINPDDPKNAIYRPVLIDFFNPENYRIINREDFQVTDPCFSADKTGILFGNSKKGASDAGCLLSYYNIENDSLVGFIRVEGNNLWGHDPVWNYNEDGFYYRHEGFGANFFNHFDISTSTNTRFPYGKSIKGIKGPDSLIVTSNINGTYVLHYCDKEGQYLDWVDNPHIQTAEETLQQKRVGIWGYNSQRSLFLISEFSFKGGRNYMFISVTNLIGTFYRQYVETLSGDKPVWGPEAKYILFTKKYNSKAGPEARSTIMVIDCITGEVRELIDPNIINGAVALRNPGY